MTKWPEPDIDCRLLLCWFPMCGWPHMWLHQCNTHDRCGICYGLTRGMRSCSSCVIITSQRPEDVVGAAVGAAVGGASTVQPHFMRALATYDCILSDCHDPGPCSRA